MANYEFEPADFLAKVGQRLVMEFDHASQAGTPGLKGGAREHPARVQFERLLPDVAGVGSGLVLDSHRTVSRQQDIVIYERHQAPVFDINNTPEATYYPVEGVVGVGEVKSTLGAKELTDAFEKIASVKKLRRVAELSPGLGPTPTVSFRQYGSTAAYEGAPEEEYDQDHKETDQVFGFILCNKFGPAAGTILERAEKLWASTPPALAPNILVSLNDGFIQPSHGSRLLHSAMGANGSSLCERSALGFPLLIRSLSNALRTGRTSPIGAYGYYLQDPNAPTQVRVVQRPYGWTGDL